MESITTHSLPLPANTSSLWAPPPLEVVARKTEVHVWRVSLDESLVPELLPTLSADERERADRFHFDRDRNRFIVARGSLRSVLALYLNREPAELDFSYTQYGKPSLAGNDVSFNLSHANELGLIAITRDRRIGVDIEFIRPDFASEQIAERFFSGQEVDVLRALAPDQQAEAFFSCWTRKEAYIKAIGEGMSMPLDQFNVSLAPGSAAALLGNLRDESEVSRWSLKELSLDPGYLGAIAVEGHGWQLKCWQANDPRTPKAFNNSAQGNTLGKEAIKLSP